jgi:hypothetical protein
MSKKKVTAPTTYNPGSGHPKEYLAYLNWQEMQALQRLNGNGPRRGPKGIPSFADDSASSMGNERPPEDSYDGYQGGGDGGFDGNSYNDVGSESGGGSDYGGSDYGGSDYGGVGGIQSSASDPSTAAPTSVAGGQNPVDAAVQQEAAYKDAVVASRQQALSQDIANGGISAINVGPMNVPVKIGGGQIAGTISDIAQQTYTPPTTVTDSGLGATGYYHSGFSERTLSLPGMTEPSRFSTEITPSNLLTEYGVPMEKWSKGYDPNKLTPGAQKIHQAIADESLRTMKPVDYFSGLRGGDSAQHTRGQAIDIRISDPVTGKPVGYEKIGEKAYNPIGGVRSGYRSPSEAAKIQSALAGPYRDFATGVIGSFYDNPDMYGEFQNQRWGGAFETGEFSKDYMHFDEGKAMSAVSRDQANLRREALARAQDPTAYAGLSPSQIGGVPAGISSLPSGVDVSPAAVELAAVEDVYGDGIYPSGSIVGPRQFGYPTKPDGTPITAEDLAAMPEDVQREYMDKMRFARMTDEKYPLTTDQKVKVAAVTGITAPITGNIFAKAGTTIVGGISGLLGKLPGQFGDAFSEVQRGMRTLAKPGQAVAAYERLDPLKQQQLATGYGVPSETPSGTSGNAGVAGIPTQELGGKNYQYQTAYYQPYQSYQTEPVERRRRRISQYERWDRGIGIPSPGDPNYNEYQEYLAAGESDRYA